MMTGLLDAVLKGSDNLASHWNQSYVVWRNAVDPASLIGSDEIERRLEASMLEWPYFTLLQDGQAPAVESYTSVRDVIGKKRDRFPCRNAILKYMDEGATLKLNSPSHWHRRTRDLVRELEAHLPASVTSYVFWTPNESRGMLPHRDAAHVLAVQLEGTKRWHLYAGPEDVASAAGLDVNTDRKSHEFTLYPGDALYLPHGWPHDAVAIDGSSLHLTFTLAEPTPEDLLEAVLRRFTKGREELIRHHHLRTLEEKSNEVREKLLLDINEITQQDWIEVALQMKREVN